MARISYCSIMISCSYLSEYSSSDRSILTARREGSKSIVTDSSIRISCRDRVERECSKSGIEGICCLSFPYTHISDQEISTSKYNNLSTRIHRGEDSHFFDSIRLEDEILGIQRSDKITSRYRIPRQ